MLRRRSMVVIATVATMGLLSALAPAPGARGSVPTSGTATDDVAGAPLTVTRPAGTADWVFRDGQGRQLTLRGFNVSGGTKLYSNGLLPYRSQDDAARSAQAMRDLTGANAVRFLISWEGVQPAPDRIDTDYLNRAAAQIREFTDRGIYVLLDYHQDLYSSHLFNPGSWYTGDGAPKWVVAAGGYPPESCGICLLWGQNMMNNEAVRRAIHDFWHNRTISTSAGPVRVQDAFLTQTEAALRHLRQTLPATSYDRIIGLDPFNEPFDGGLDGQSALDWERDWLMPFYQRIRSVMDSAGWVDRPAFVEPLPFWNTGVAESGGFGTTPPLGERFVFNTHYYDGPRLTYDLTPAGDGTYAGTMNRIRERARALATAPIVSEFGARLTGWASNRTPWIIRSQYQGMDAGVSGANWWSQAANAGPVLSSTLWHWDIHSGRHHELMNGNPDKVLTEGDAWNDEDHSVVRQDDSGAVTLRLDRRVLDRLYPTAVAGRPLAFTYEDLARSGYGGAGQQRAWLAAPTGMPAVASLINGRQAGVLVWRTDAGSANTPTELHLPGSFAPASTVVVSDIATTYGIPAAGPVAVTTEVGSTTARRLLITPTDGGAETLHVVLVVNAGAGAAPTAAQLAAARTELVNWRTQRFGG